MEMPPPKTKQERDERKVARAVGDTVEFRDPGLADADDRALDADVLDADFHREQLGFPSHEDPFGVAVPTGIAQYKTRPLTAPNSFLSRPIKLNETQGSHRAARRATPLADASSRLAAIEHRQAQLKEQAATTTAGDSNSQVMDSGIGSNLHHTADTMLPGKEVFREHAASANKKFAVGSTTHPHNAPVSDAGRRIR